MDDKKIAFITCVDDEVKYEECRFYLNRLYIPEDHTIDIISIKDAPSMAAGYNAAMKETDAKYKIYLHQDTFIKNRYFLSDMLNIFFADSRIGMLGMIGTKKQGTTALGMSKWDVGSVIYDYQVMKWDLPEGKSYIEVATIDGFLMATQYDIPWREDIFDGWDFYDHSQCMEFKREGYKVVVPYQEEIWCCHDGLSSNLTAYFDYYEKFIHEYSGSDHTSARDEGEMILCRFNKEYAYQIVRLKESIERLFDIGEKERLGQFFQDPEFQSNVHLREYRSIVRVDQIEEQKGSERRFWDTGMKASQLIARFRRLKYALKRIEYGVEDAEKMKIWEDYSKYAVKEVCEHHILRRDEIYMKLGNLCLEDI